MARLWLLAAIVLCVSIPPALAQDAADPAARIPDSASAYLELRVDENLEANLQDMALLTAFWTGASPESVAEEMSFNAVLEQILPGVTFEDDILPWIGERVGIGLFGDFTESDPDFVVVLPVTDAEAADAFITRVAQFFPRAATEGEINTYMNAEYQLVSTPDYIVGGTLPAMEMVTNISTSLAGDAAFTETRAALPANSLASVYLSGRLIRDAASESIPESDMGFPGPAELFETALRLHPAESEMEDALLQIPPINGAAFALELTDERLDIMGVLSLDAEYRAPTLATASAGTGLIAYVPRDAYTVFSSYDSLGTLGISVGGVGGLAIMGPAIGSVFDNIVAELNATPGATPTPLPTPTPIPTPSADDLLTQVQPFVAQAEAFLGIELDALYELLAGEYAIAAFPVDNPATENLGGALWIQTDDPARVGRLLDSVMTMASGQLAPGGSTLPTRTEETINGVEMIVWGIPGEGESLVYGALADDVFVVTLKSSMDAVANASRGDGVLVQSRNWPGDIAGDEYSAGLEMLTYMDIGGVMKLNPMSQPVPFISLIAGLDMQDDGLFVGRMTLTRGS